MVVMRGKGNDSFYSRLELHTIVKEIERKGDHTVATWILVSDTSRAKLFSADKREDDWTLLKVFEHP